jgi:tetratricopeptide (TPR) repeat protein
MTGRRARCAGRRAQGVVRGAARRVLLLATWGFLLAAPAHAEPLTGLPGLVRVYDAILDARFDDAAAELKRACGPAPAEACDVLAATATWWRILIDPNSRALDEQFSAEVERAIRSTEAWTEREPKNAEAHFYAGGAYAARVQWRVLRDEKLAAARDGKRIKQALERAIALDPSLDDAYFGIGLYQYYADVAPAAAKVLRFLLMLPGGDKTEGLAQMRRARTRGKLLQGEADYQLHILYLWYEKRADLAAGLLESLVDRHPGNPIFTAQLADLQDRYEHDVTASLATWRGLLTAARDGRVNEAEIAATQARLGIARQLEALHHTDQALEYLRAILADRPSGPVGAVAAAYLALGEAEDRLGHHDAALAAYALAIQTAPSPDTDAIRRRAAERSRRPPDPRRAEAYRLSLEGLRRLEKSDAAGAESLLLRSLTLHPADPVARYRYARVLLAKKDDERALAEFESAIRGARDAPAPLAAAAYYEAARIHERLGHTDEAIAYYQAAQTWFGGGADTRNAATRALARLRAVK